MKRLNLFLKRKDRFLEVQTVGGRGKIHIMWPLKIFKLLDTHNNLITKLSLYLHYNFYFSQMPTMCNVLLYYDPLLNRSKK